jgi:hypothetical protein
VRSARTSRGSCPRGLRTCRRTSRRTYATTSRRTNPRLAILRTSRWSSPPSQHQSSTGSARSRAPGARRSGSTRRRCRPSSRSCSRGRRSQSSRCGRTGFGVKSSKTDRSNRRRHGQPARTRSSMRKATSLTRTVSASPASICSAYVFSRTVYMRSAAHSLKIGAHGACSGRHGSDDRHDGAARCARGQRGARSEGPELVGAVHAIVTHGMAHAAHRWRGLEAALAALGAQADSVLEVIQDEQESSKPVPVDVASLLANVIPALLRLSGSCPSRSSP